MTESEPDTTKEAKKLAKAAEKAAKKEAKAEAAARAAEAGGNGANATPDPNSPAERSAWAAERKVRLEQWRTVFAAVTALAALITIVFALRGGCG